MRLPIVRTLILSFLLPIASVTSSFARAQIAGDWQGTLHAGGLELRLVLHIASKDGALSASLDSIDQGALGIPVSSITLKESKLNLAVDAVHGTYEGTVAPDASAINGTWTQGTPLELNFKRAEKAEAKPEPKPAAPTDLDGSWLGLLNAGETKLRIIFKVMNTTEGLTAKMQSPDQGPAWIPVSSVVHDGASVNFTLKGLAIDFSGKVTEDHQLIEGTFIQMGNEMPLKLERMKE